MSGVGARFGESRWTDPADPWDWADVQDRFDRLAAGSVMFKQGLFADRPAAGIAGRVFKATDTGALFYDDGVAWSPVCGGGSSGYSQSFLLMGA